jgi:hypothetical protein
MKPLDCGLTCDWPLELRKEKSSMTSPKSRRIALPFLCPLGLLIVTLAHLMLAAGELSLAITHREPLYLLLVAADLVQLVLFAYKSFKLFRTRQVNPRRGRRRR